MARASDLQGNFLGGEWSPNADGRVDLPARATALALCRNSYPTEEGAWQKREPFISLGASYKNYPFAVAEIQTADATIVYIEFSYNSGAVYLRFWSDLSAIGLGNPGVPALVPDDGVFITAVSSADPCEITLDTAVTWSTGDLIQIWPDITGSGGTQNIPQLYGRQCLITKADTTHFTLADAVTGDNIDSTGWGSISVGANTYAAHIQVITTDYTTQADLPGYSLKDIHLVPASDEVYFLSPNYQPYALTIGGQFIPTEGPPLPLDGSNYVIPFSLAWASAGFISTSANEWDGPYNDPLPGASQLGYDIGTVGMTGSATPGFSSASYAFVTADVGRQIRIWSQPPVYNPGTSYSAGAVATFQGAFYEMGYGSVPAGTAPTGSYTAGGTTTYPWIPVPQQGVWAYGVVTSVAGGNCDLKLDGMAGEVPVANGTSIDQWQLGRYTDNGAVYPSCGTFANGRLVLSGASAGQVDASSANSFLFSPSDEYGNVTDAHAISVQLNTPPTTQMNWLLPDRLGIICGTSVDEWLIAPGAEGILSPLSIDANRMTRYGSVRIDPVRVGPAILFVQAQRRTLIEYMVAPFASTNPVGWRLNTFAKHLTAGAALINGFTYVEEPTPLLWVSTTAGTLLSCTYRRTSAFGNEPPAFYGWAHHDYGTVTEDPDIGVFGGIAGGGVLALTDPNGNNTVSILPPPSSGGSGSGYDGSPPGNLTGSEPVDLTTAAAYFDGNTTLTGLPNQTDASDFVISVWVRVNDNGINIAGPAAWTTANTDGVDAGYTGLASGYSAPTWKGGSILFGVGGGQIFFSFQTELYATTCIPDGAGGGTSVDISLTQLSFGLGADNDEPVTFPTFPSVGVPSPWVHIMFSRQGGQYYATVNDTVYSFGADILINNIGVPTDVSIQNTCTAGPFAADFVNPPANYSAVPFTDAVGSSITEPTVPFGTQDSDGTGGTDVWGIAGTGAFYDLWYDPGNTLDITSAINRAKFHTQAVNGAYIPVSLGANGETPTGSEPLIYCTGKAADFVTNLGSGGGTLTVVGDDLTNVPGPAAY